ncbi:MAG: BamA/TamA family outer membrane protein, partial [Thermodesulfobacteriota bacterium]|nr:BamA/TamA family outer membrane protein [Thermodesulfobacteriota bacterium]
NKEHDELYYTKKSVGGTVRLSYPVIEEIRHYISYRYDKVKKLEDIDPTYEYLLSEDDKNGGLTSSITNTLYRNTTNDYYRPTEGSNCSVSVEYAGLGGDYHFTRSKMSAAKFFPIYKDTVALMFKLRTGTINSAKGDKVPDYEKFTLGGMNTLRGFDYGGIGPKDSYGNFLGGKQMVIFNTEITFPMGKVPGLSGVIFYDAGNAYNERVDLSDIRQSYGAGIRWVTPMGPLRLEYGKVVHPEKDEDNGQWEFTIGAFF